MEETIMELRYCPSCCRERLSNTFKLIDNGKGARRWKCGVCQEKKSATFYGKNK